MNRHPLILICFFLFFYLPSVLNAQTSKEKNIRFSQNDFRNYKIDNDTYTFWSSKYDNRWIPKRDTLPYFVDERNYKGILNYGIEYSLVDNRNLYYNENHELYKLNISIDWCLFNPKDSIVDIKGTVKGGWLDDDVRDIRLDFKNNINVFIGKKKDTLRTLIFENKRNPEEYIVKYKGEEVIEPIVLDSFPSFYLYDYVHFRTNSGKEREFTIKSKIEKNSVLTFGLFSSFAEIYDIGAMVFSDNSKGIRRAKNGENNKSYPIYIVRNNVQESNKKNYVKLEISEYHKITSKAEDYIMRRQFGKAKLEYQKLLEEQKNVFARDLHNAIRCATIGRDYNMVISCAEKLVLKGASLQYFNNKIFDRLKKKPLWNLFVEKYENLNRQYKSNLNHSLINELDALVALDQAAYKKNIKKLIKRTELLGVTDSVNSRLYNLIKEEGFPTEEKIGAEFSQDSMGIRNPDYYVLLYHNYQTKGKNFSKIMELRNKAAQNLEYDAYRDNLEVFKKSGNPCLQIYKGNLYNNKSCNLNKNEVKKIKFRFNNEYNFIMNSGEFVIIPYEKVDEKQDEGFIKDRFNFVTKLTDDWFFYEK